MESNIYVIAHRDAHFEKFARVSCVSQTVTQCHTYKTWLLSCAVGIDTASGSTCKYVKSKTA